MIFAELASRIAKGLQQLGYSWILRTKPKIGSRKPHLGQPRANRRLAGDERSAARRAALLRIPVGEHGAFARYAVDVRRAVAHHALVVGADVVPADVVTPDDEDVGLALLGQRGAGDHGQERDAEEEKPLHRRDAPKELLPHVASSSLRRQPEKREALSAPEAADADQPVPIGAVGRSGGRERKMQSNDFSLYVPSPRKPTTACLYSGGHSWW